ncbi:MAG: Fic family protein, partial [Bacteroidota bacterium]
AVFDNVDGKLLHSPPPAQEIPQRLEALCAFANQPLESSEVFMHPVVHAIVLHFMLAYDHPFVDGNGRTARALFYWAMLSHGYWLMEYTSISSILKQAPARYGRSFLYTETDRNDTTYFLLSQARVIEQAISALHQYAKRKSAQLRQADEAIHATGLNQRQLALLSHAIRNPNAEYTIRSHRGSHGVAYQTARTDLAELDQLGYLNMFKRSRQMVYTPSTALFEELNQ